METAASIVELLCDLSESSDEAFHASRLGPECVSGLQYLTGLGAIEQGPRPETVVCSACDTDHPALIEFDVEQRCYVHFCPEAGLVTVNDADLITHRFRPEWLADWLAMALRLTSPLRRSFLVDGRVWYLGDTVCGDTLVTVIFARQVSSRAEFDLLMSALRPIHPAGKGLVVTTSPHVTRHVPLPNGFELLDLGDIIRWAGDRLIVDRANFDSQVRASRQDRKEPSRLDYREADKPLIDEMHAMIVGGTARNATDAARALASRAAGSGKGVSKVTRLAAGYIKVYPGG